jgi:hypothetical protein
MIIFIQRGVVVKLFLFFVYIDISKKRKRRKKDGKRDL